LPFQPDTQKWKSVTAQKGGMYFEHRSVLITPTHKFRDAKFCIYMFSHKLQKKKKKEKKNENLAGGQDSQHLQGLNFDIRNKADLNKTLQRRGKGEFRKLLVWTQTLISITF
jgi:hypothetical protein